MNNDYTFKKGDSGKCRNGATFEVIAEFKVRETAPNNNPLRIAVVLTHSNGAQTLQSLNPDGKWSGGSEHHLDLMVPTEKRWVVRADSKTRLARQPSALSYEFKNKTVAEETYESFSRLDNYYNNITLTEIDVPVRRD